MNKAIGAVELSSIARGYQTADGMLKTANVGILLSRSVCPGKYIVLVAGEVGEVKASVDAGERLAAHALVDSFLIANMHEDVFPAISGNAVVNNLDALGIIEGFSIAGVIEAADAAIKAASVKLIEIRLAMALGGKAFVTLTGSVAAVEHAVKAGSEILSNKGLLVERIVIPQPKKELLNDII